MSGTITVSHSEDKTTISIKGRFNFEMHSQFRTAYQSEAGDKKKKRYVIDLTGTEYIDSSALGMLLLLREEAGGNEADIEIVNARPEIRKILETANFQRLFKIV